MCLDGNVNISMPAHSSSYCWFFCDSSKDVAIFIFKKSHIRLCSVHGCILTFLVAFSAKFFLGWTFSRLCEGYFPHLKYFLEEFCCWLLPLWFGENFEFMLLACFFVSKRLEFSYALPIDMHLSDVSCLSSKRFCLTPSSLADTATWSCISLCSSLSKVL